MSDVCFCFVECVYLVQVHHLLESNYCFHYGVSRLHFRFSNIHLISVDMCCHPSLFPSSVLFNSLNWKCLIEPVDGFILRITEDERQKEAHEAIKSGFHQFGIFVGSFFFEKKNV